jgi:hypothetical protein
MSAVQAKAMAHSIETALAGFVEDYLNACSANPASQVLRDFGRYFPGCPNNQQSSIPKQCFMNATLAMDSDHRYTEGLAVRSSLLIPVAHAWLTNDAGVAIDTTWSKCKPGEQSAYFGIQFDPDFVEEHSSRTGYYGVFETMYMLRMSAEDQYEYLRSGIAWCQTPALESQAMVMCR